MLLCIESAYVDPRASDCRLQPTIFWSLDSRLDFGCVLSVVGHRCFHSTNHNRAVLCFLQSHESSLEARQASSSLDSLLILHNKQQARVKSQHEATPTASSQYLYSRSTNSIKRTSSIPIQRSHFHLSNSYVEVKL